MSHEPNGDLGNFESQGLADSRKTKTNPMGVWEDLEGLTGR
jgi:hypothetical protein